MEVPLFVLLLGLSFAVITNCVHPGCECLIFSATYGKEKGIFKSPDHPLPYPANIDCLLYTFIASSDEIIEIEFLEFDILKTQTSCVQEDYMKLFLHIDSGEINEYTPWSALFCGQLKHLPSHTLYSSGPGLVLEFHTGPQLPKPAGFLGTFKFIDKKLFRIDGQKLPGTMCDYQFIASDYSPAFGKFYSPRYPSSYPKNVRCSYRFRAKFKERVRIVFEEVFLQKGDLSCLNRADIIRIHDGRSSNDPTIRVLCNEETEVEVLSTGYDLFVDFIANSEWPGKGFKASFQFQAMDDTSLTGNIIKKSENGSGISSTPNGPNVSEATTTITPFTTTFFVRYHVRVCPPGSSCDNTYSSDTAKNGTIISPGYPSPYPERTTCRYDLVGRGRERVQIVFHDFNLFSPNDNSKDCNDRDSLMVFVYIDGRMEKIETFCGGNLPNPIMSNGPRLKLEFHGNSGSRLSRGFKATYVFTEDFGIKSGVQLPDYPCAFVFNSSVSEKGHFHSPNFPGLYPRDTECHYYFYGNQGERVRLHFLYFDVEGVLPCEATTASDYLEFSNYMHKDQKYSRYCGQMNEFSIDSDRIFFRVTFRSNDRLDGKGFNATYKFINEEIIPTVIMVPTNIVPNFKGTPKIIFVALLLLSFSTYT